MTLSSFADNHKSMNDKCISALHESSLTRLLPRTVSPFLPLPLLWGVNFETFVIKILQYCHLLYLWRLFPWTFPV